MIGEAARAAAHDPLVLLGRVRDAAASSAERVGGANYRRQADPLARSNRLIPVLNDLGLRDRLADLAQQVAEALAVLGELDRVERGAEQPHVVAIEHAGLGEVDREVEAGLPTEGRQQAVGPLGRDDALDDLDGQWLDVDDVGDALVGHDRRGVRVDEDGRDALLAHGLACLGAGVVELGSLPDHDRAAADDQDLFRACGGRHRDPFVRRRLVVVAGAVVLAGHDDLGDHVEVREVDLGVGRDAAELDVRDRVLAEVLSRGTA